MRFDQKMPCANCPFRKCKEAVRLDPDRIDEIADDEHVFSCHKTVDYSEDDGGRTNAKTQACAGSLAFQLKEGDPNKMFNVAVAFKLAKFETYKTPEIQECIVDRREEMEFGHGR